MNNSFIQKQVVQGCVDSVSNSEITSNATVYNTISIKDDDGNIHHYTDVLVYGALTGYFGKGTCGEFFMITIAGAKNAIVGLKKTDGTKIYDLSPVRELEQEFQRQKISNIMLCLMSIPLFLFIIGLFSFIVGIFNYRKVKKSLKTLREEDVRGFLENNDFVIDAQHFN